MIEIFLQFGAGMVVIAVGCALASRIAESALDWLFKKLESRLVASRSRHREPAIFINGNPAPFDRAVILQGHNDNA